MFIWYSLSSILATFLIFAHSYQGKEYAFVIGLTLIMIMCAYRYEKGYSLSKTMFTCIFLPLVGAIGLGIYRYEKQFMNNLDSVVATYVIYQFVFIVVGILATVIFLYKLMLSNLLNRQIKAISGKNHMIYMNSSSADYLTPEQIAQKESRVRRIVAVAAWLFVMITVVLSFALLPMKIVSEELELKMLTYPCLCVSACWLFACFYILNSGMLAILVTAGGCFLFNSVLALGGHGIFADSISASLPILLWMFVPSLAMFFLRELKIIPSFEEY